MLGLVRLIQGLLGGFELGLERFNALGVSCNGLVEVPESRGRLFKAGRLELDRACGFFDRPEGHRTALLRGFELMTGFGQLLFELTQRTRPFVMLFADFAVPFLGLAERCFGAAFLVLERGELGCQALKATTDIVVLLEGERHAQGAVLGVELLESACLARLPFDQTQTALGGVELLACADEVCLGFLELPLRLDATQAVLRDARGFLEDDASLHRRREKHAINLALLDDRVRVGADARIEEEIANVLETCGAPVDDVLGLAVAEELAFNGDLVGVDGKRTPDAMTGRQDRGGFGFTLFGSAIRVRVGDVLVVRGVMLFIFRLFGVDRFWVFGGQ